MRSSRFHTLLGAAVIVVACVAAHAMLDRAKDEVLRRAKSTVAAQIVSDTRARPPPRPVPIPDEFQQLRRYLPKK